MTMEASPLYCCCGLSGFGIGFFFLAGGGGTFLVTGFGGMRPFEEEAVGAAELRSGCAVRGLAGRTGCPAPAVVVVVAVAGGWLKPWPCGALAAGLDAVG